MLRVGSITLLSIPMALLSPPSSALVPDAPAAAGPVCSLQRVAPKGAPGRSASLWQLGIEAQERTTGISLLAEQLEADDDDTRSNALAELEAALLAEEGNKAALAAKAVAERFRAAVATTCWVIEHLHGQAAYRQQQAERLTELSRSDASRADAPEDSLVLVLTRLQPTATRFSFPNHELTSRKSQAIEIDDEDSLASEWVAGHRHHHQQARQGRHQRSPQSRPPDHRRPARLPPLLAHPLRGGRAPFGMGGCSCGPRRCSRPQDSRSQAQAPASASASAAGRRGRPSMRLLTHTTP